MASRSAPVFAALLTLGLLIGTALPVPGQSPYTGCAHRTATNASLILPSDLEVFLDGTPQKGPIYLAVFTPEGECAGRAKWSGSGVTLTAWGTDEAALASTASDSALVPGDSMEVRLFMPDTDTEYTSENDRVTVSFRSDQPHLTTHRRYVPNGMYVVDQIRVYERIVSKQE